jgi:hypothetical protein
MSASGTLQKFVAPHRLPLSGEQPTNSAEPGEGAILRAKRLRKADFALMLKAFAIAVENECSESL